MKYLAIWLIVAIVIILTLSFFVSIPYIYTITGVSIITVIGHLATIDDDFMGGWNNLVNSVHFWKSSLFELLIKLAFQFFFL